MQYAVPDLEKLSIDLAALSKRRDRMLAALSQWGYEMVPPEGTFYLFGKAPGGDSEAFFDAMAERDVFVMPGTLFDTPGHFRLSLTANETMIERSLPVFQEVASSV
jgi:aspartate aminotransferase